MITLKSNPYIIAEVGSNWHTFEDAKNAIAQAKNAGADAVKFQFYDGKRLYGMEREMKGAMPMDWVGQLKQKCDAVGIDFMITCFTPEDYKEFDKLISMHKVASAEMQHVRILDTLRRLGKPVLLSTGGQGKADVEKAITRLQGEDKSFTDIIPLYCVSAYPARDVDFRQMAKLQEMSPSEMVGYSDHTLSASNIPLIAKNNGAVVIEKHFNPYEFTDTPDARHSLTTDEFMRMVKSLRGQSDFVWGSGQENDMRKRHNRRLVVTQDIRPGQAFKEGENFGIYRAIKDDDKGLSPFMAEKIEGKSPTRLLRAGETIGPRDVE